MDGKSVHRRPPPPLRTSATPPARGGVLESEEIAMLAGLASFLPLLIRARRTRLNALKKLPSFGKGPLLKS
jgi:hypothetical protein